MALDLEMPTPAVVQSFIQPPTSSAVMMPARNDARKLTRLFGIIFRSTANASEAKISVMKKSLPGVESEATSPEKGK